MYFGIRGKVALLVMVATAAAALLVTTVLTYRATDILRDHELVDLGDEAELRGWEIMDRIDGLRDDLINIAFSPTFQEDVALSKPQSELESMARGLCRRHWERHLRIDLVSFEEGSSTFTLITEKGTLNPDDLWFPGPDAQAGARIHVSEIQRLLVNRTDLAGSEGLQRWEPVIWAIAPLDTSPGKPPVYVRILMSLHDNPSPRHLFAIEDARGNRLVRHEESESSEPVQYDVFTRISQHPDIVEKLEVAREVSQSESEPVDEPKVDRLAVAKYVPLDDRYFFLEGTPGEMLRDAFDAKSDESFEEFSELLEVKLGSLGRIGGLRSGVKEIRLLARTEESLKELRDGVEEELKVLFGETYDGIDWRARVECDEIHSWGVRLLVGQGRSRSEYILYYAVLDDELASSIEYEMLALRRVALLVAFGFGIVGFLIAMHFIRPLKQMTKTAQEITGSHREGLYKKVSALARRLDNKRRDEVGDIARASKRLFEELITFQSELENRVQERTRELRRANSELEDAYEKLMSLSHEKDAFVAKVSHDLRQPLNAIFLQVEALKLSPLDEMQAKDVQRIHDHAARELNLVNDILEYQKIIMGAETLSKDTIEVEKLLSDLEESHRPVIEAKGITFTKQSAEDTGTIVADDRRIRQVLNNLVGNAGKFTKEGSVTIDARPREIEGKEWVEFTVTDTGRGMSPQEQSKAFVPFVSNKKDNAGGSGLGLSICKELVGQMGGRIGFVSELDKGTHFSVFVPRIPVSEYYEAHEEDTVATEANGEADDEERLIAHGGTILVIDDDPKVRNLLSRILKHDGYEVITAEDGHEGIELAKEHTPDAITLDVVMPGGKDGWDVLRELKEAPSTKSIPVIMVSVMAEQENGLALDVEDYLVKPIDVDRLSRVIARVTDHIPQRNILLVDDDQSSLDSMSRILEHAGWHPTTANDGEEALLVLEKTRPAAIVLDLLMPGMDGFEFLQHIQADKQLSSIPVIVMSGKDPNESEQEFLEKRVSTILKKGKTSSNDLLASINSRIRARRHD